MHHIDFNHEFSFQSKQCQKSQWIENWTDCVEYSSFCHSILFDALCECETVIKCPPANSHCSLNSFFINFQVICWSLKLIVRQWTKYIWWITLKFGQVETTWSLTSIISWHNCLACSFYRTGFKKSFIWNSVHWVSTPHSTPLFLAKPPPLNLQTVQVLPPLFRQSPPPIYCFFMTPPPLSKTRIFPWTSKILEFFILHPILSFKSN